MNLTIALRDRQPRHTDPWHQDTIDGGHQDLTDDASPTPTSTTSTIICHDEFEIRSQCQRQERESAMEKAESDRNLLKGTDPTETHL
jgi:hypothetical protein